MVAKVMKGPFFCTFHCGVRCDICYLFDLAHESQVGKHHPLLTVICCGNAFSAADKLNMAMSCRVSYWEKIEISESIILMDLLHMCFTFREDTGFSKLHTFKAVSNSRIGIKMASF